MRRWSFLIIFLALSLLSCAGAGRRTDAGPVELTILHVNDTHGRIVPYKEITVDPVEKVSGSAYLAALIEEERSKNPGGTLLLSGGDMFQGTPISNVFSGEPVLEVMNALGFDAMVIGNHEFDWGMEKLQTLKDKARFPFLTANITGASGRGPAGSTPYVMLDRRGLKIAVIGVTTSEVAYTTKPEYVQGFTVRKPQDVLPDLIKKVRAEGADFVIVLSHIGIVEDRSTVASVRGIDLVIGGHSHTAVMEHVKVGGTIIAQAGYNGLYLGVLRCRVEKGDAGPVLAKTAGGLRLVSAGAQSPFDPRIGAIVDRYNEQIKPVFGRVVGETDVDLVTSKTSETNMGNLMADAMRSAAKTDIAFQNSGGIRTNLPKGKITMEKVYEVLPFDNVLVTMDMTGSAVLQVLEQGGGGEYGLLQMSGATVVYDFGKQAGNRVVRAEVAGKPIDPGRTYRVVTNDFAATGGDRLLAFQQGKNVVYGDNLRDVFVAYLQKNSPAAPRIEGRITINR